MTPEGGWETHFSTQKSTTLLTFSLGRRIVRRTYGPPPPSLVRVKTYIDVHKVWNFMVWEVYPICLIRSELRLFFENPYMSIFLMVNNQHWRKEDSKASIDFIGLKSDVPYGIG